MRYSVVVYFAYLEQQEGGDCQPQECDKPFKFYNIIVQIIITRSKFIKFTELELLRGVLA